MAGWDYDAEGREVEAKGVKGGPRGQRRNNGKAAAAAAVES